MTLKQKQHVVCIESLQTTQSKKLKALQVKLQTHRIHSVNIRGLNFNRTMYQTSQCSKIQLGIIVPVPQSGIVIDYSVL